MTINWRRLTIFLCIILPVTTNAQNVGEDEGILSTHGFTRFVGFGVGPTYRSFLDRSLSDIEYHRAGATVSVSNEKTDELQHSELSIQASYLNMQREATDLLKGSARSFKGVADYRHTYRINFLNENKYDVRVGGVLSGLVDYRKAPHLGYSGTSFDYAFSLGAYGRLSRLAVMNGRDGNIVLDLAIPFISDIGRPPFNYTGGLYNPDYKPWKAFFSTSQAATFGRFLRFVTRVQVIYPLKNGNKIKFTYQWDYYKMRGATSVYSVEHTLMVAFMFNY